MDFIKAKASNRLRKNQVSSASDLFRYLKQISRSTKRIYHYTSYESLLIILRNKSLRLTRLDSMNDKAEQKLISGTETDQNYIISFCNDQTEYVSMWAMYGKASGIKVRIDFTSGSLEAISKENYFFDSNLTKKIPITSGGKLPFLDRDTQISDVVYLNKQRKNIKHNTNPFPKLIYNEKLRQQLSGFIKYDAWEFEKERRLKVTLTDKNQSDSTQYIYLKLTDEFLSGISVTYNPWISPDLYKELRIALNRVTGRKLDQKLSSNHGEICEL